MSFRTALALVVLTATTAVAQRVSFPSFTGPSAASVRNQIVSAVCDTADCVPATKTTTAGKPDWKKGKKESVQFFVTGSVTRKGKALSLDLFVYNKAGAPKAKKNFPLDKSGSLSGKNLQAAMDLLTGAFGAKRAPPPEPKDEPVAPAPKEPTKTTPRPSDPPPPPRVERTERPTPEPEPEARGEPEPEPRPRGKQKPVFLVIDAAIELLNRRLEYTQVATSNLRRYDLQLYGQAALGAQFYPLALVRDDLLAGLGVELGIAFAPWLQSRLTSIPDAFPTSTTRFDALVRFNIAPLKSFPLTFSPYLGVRTQSFVVGALSDGRRIDGLPNIGFVGLRAGLAVDVPVAVGWVSVFGRFGIVPVFGSGEIISPTFFPTGSAFGLEADAGLSVRILPFLQARASFEFARYGLTFNAQPTDTYVAAGAVDTYLGGRVGLRLSF